MQYAVQRVIQTDLFFNPKDINWKFPELIFNAPGISMAFFRGDSKKVKWREIISNPIHPRGNARTAATRRFLDAALQNAPFKSERGSLRDPELNGPIIDLIFDQEVITESSPAVSTAFKKLLGSAPVITVGALIGIGGFHGDPMLFVEVPAGILAVGAPVVVLEWLRKGGSHLIDRVLKPEPAKQARKKKQK